MQRIKLLFATSGDDRRTVDVWRWGEKRAERREERGESFRRLSASTLKATKHRIACGRAAVSRRRGPCRTRNTVLPPPATQRPVVLIPDVSRVGSLTRGCTCSSTGASPRRSFGNKALGAQAPTKRSRYQPVGGGGEADHCDPAGRGMEAGASSCLPPRGLLLVGDRGGESIGHYSVLSGFEAWLTSPACWSSVLLLCGTELAMPKLPG
jgi:hypothetical protein